MRKALIVYMAVMVVMLYLMFHMTQAMTLKVQELQESLDLLYWEYGHLQDQIEELNRQREEEQPDRERLRELREFLDRVEEKDVIVSAYAPLDPRAKEGICYQGNPNVTASGSCPVPDLTAAAGPGTPFYTLAYVAGHGWRIINDHGGAITNDRMDLVMETQAEAFQWGRQKLKVLVLQLGVRQAYLGWKVEGL